MDDFATVMIAARHESLEMLCLLGGSRQHFMAKRAEATVFTGDCPVAPTIRCMNPQPLPAAESLANGLGDQDGE
jgi:hypothetical protein